ncbi:MAG: hypothetical protein NXI04_00535 [Planctomycetaceae bacterium]|nr:hypothetical protein [Planctomycetaceae bacterium]
MSDSLPQLLLTHAWQIAAMTLLVLIVAKLLGDSRPRLVHALWLLVIVKCLTPPLWGHSLGVFSSAQALFPDTEPARSAAAVTTSPIIAADPEMSAAGFDDRITRLSLGQPAENDNRATPGQYPQTAAKLSPEVTTAGGTALSPWLTLLAGGALLHSLVLITRYLRCVRNIRARRVSDFDTLTQPLLEQLCDKLQIRRAPDIIVSDVRWGPAVMGFFRRVIVLPRCLLDTTADTDQRPVQWLEPIIAHELLHIRRGDLFAGVLQSVARCLWWFHPGVWFASRMLSRETERCCDADVIKELGCRPSAYARCLLSVIEMKQPLKAVPVFPGMKPVEITSQRMERIMSQSTETRRRPWQNRVVITLAAVLLLPGAAASRLSTDENSARELKTDTTAAAASADHGGRLVVLTSESALREHPQQLAALHQTLGEFRKMRLTVQAIQHEMSELQTLLRKAGFLDASVDAKMQDGPVGVRYTVDSGARYRIRRIQGSTPLQVAPIDLPRLSRLFASRYSTADSLKQVRKSVARDFHIRELPPPNIRITPVFNRQSDQVDLTIEVLHAATDSPPANEDTAVATIGTISLTSDQSNVLQQIGAVNSQAATSAAAKAGENSTDESVTQQISAAITSDQGQTGTVQITVTPRIIIQEEEEELFILPVVPEGTTKPQTESDAKENGAGTMAEQDQLSTRVYPVADLIVAESGTAVPLSHVPIEQRKAATQATPAPPRRYTLRTAPPTLRSVPVLSYDLPIAPSSHQATGDLPPDETQRAMTRSTVALTALIKASVRPDSWDDEAKIDVQRDSLSLLIRQTRVGHDQITDLLSDLRREQDVMIVIQAQVLQLSKETRDRLEGVDLQQTGGKYEWALLGESKVGSIVKTLQNGGAQVLSSPSIAALPNVRASVEISKSDVAPSIRLAATARPIEDTQLMRLQFEAALGNLTPVNLTTTLKSRQTLLLRCTPLADEADTGEQNQVLRDALNRKVSIHFRNVPLTEVLRDISGIAQINTILDAPALSRAGLEPDPKVSINLQNVPLKTALKQVLAQSGGLTWKLGDNMLQITTQASQPSGSPHGHIIAITPRIIRRSELPVQP